MKRKTLSVLMTGAMAISMLAGCQPSSGENSGNTSGSEFQKTESGTAGEVTSSENSGGESSDGDIYNMVMEVITYGFDDPDLQLVEEAVNKITEASIGVHVTFMTVPSSDMVTKLSLLSASGEKIDLVQAGLEANLSDLAKQGLIIPMTDYLSGTMVDKAGALLEACYVDGEVYAYPGSYYPGLFCAYIYDKDLAEQYNIDMPDVIESEEDWEHIFSQVKESGMSQYAISLGDGFSSERDYGIVFDALGEENYQAYGVVLDIENGDTVVNWYATDEYKQQCELHRSWYEKGYALPDSVSNGYTVGDSMMQDQIFGFAGTVGVGTSIASYSQMTKKNLDYVPIGSETPIIKKADAVNTAWAISSSCENPQKVCDFLELMYTSAELGNLLTYGIEGQHYVVNGESRIISYPEGIDAGSVGYGAFIGRYGDDELLYFREPTTEEFVGSISSYGAGEATCSRFLGYTFDTTNVQSELTAVTAAVGQYAPALICGTVDPETVIPEFLSALESAGINKIIEENQKQLTAWLEQ